MSSQPGTARENGPQRSPSPGKRPSDSHPLDESSPSRYKDDEDSEGAGEARHSGDYGDLELGNVPLLPAEPPDDYRDSSDSDLEEFGRQQTRCDPSFSCTLAGFAAWCRGPVPPHVYRINPWFPKWQAAPARLVDRWVPRRAMKIALLLVGLLFWVAVFFSSLKASVAEQEVLGYGQPVKLSCHHRLWNNATDCGLDGELCLPFDDQSFAFRCPSGCAAAILLEPYNVGDQEYNYRSQVIGGKPSKSDGHNSGIYRGDSSICASALHAGLISDAKGGCGILHRRGERNQFESVTLNGIESMVFMPHFPMSFVLTRETSSSGSSEAKLVECVDIRWSLFAFTVVFTTVLSMTVTSAPAFYSAIYFIVWFQVAMASDPPTSGYYNLVSIGLGRFFPGAFVGFVMYYFCVKHTLRNLDAHLEKTVLWLGGCWVGALNTDTFDRIPISRLTPHDIQQQPGAATALFIIVGLLIVITLVQAHAFRREGRFLPMLRLYAGMIFCILILIAVPHMNLRIHHYILALLLLPGTTLQTRPSLLFQGILVGLFINGIARWGFDSILQTPAALLDGGKLGTTLPQLSPPHIKDQDHLVFSFPKIPPRVDGVTVLVNDVQRYQSFKPRDGNSVEEFAWSRRFSKELEYFRFGYVHINALGGVWYEDFSAAATWAIDGNFSYPG